MCSTRCCSPLLLPLLPRILTLRLPPCFDRCCPSSSTQCVSYNTAAPPWVKPRRKQKQSLKDIPIPPPIATGKPSLFGTTPKTVDLSGLEGEAATLEAFPVPSTTAKDNVIKALDSRYIPLYLSSSSTSSETAPNDDQQLTNYIVQWVPLMKPSHRFRPHLSTLQNQLTAKLAVSPHSLHLPSILIAFRQIRFPLFPALYLQLYAQLELTTINEHNCVALMETFLMLQQNDTKNAMAITNFSAMQAVALRAFEVFKQIVEYVCSEIIWLDEAQLLQIVHLHQYFAAFIPSFFDMLGERLRLRFDFFTEHQIGDISRVLVHLKTVDDRKRNRIHSKYGDTPPTVDPTLQQKHSNATHNPEGVESAASSPVSLPLLLQGVCKEDPMIRISSHPNAFLLSNFNLTETSILSAFESHLPYVLHEYKYWNLIDIAEMYLLFRINDEEMIVRFGVEAWKVVLSMRFGYPAKALRVLAFLETSDARTFRSLIRNVPRILGFTWPAELIAETLVACAMVHHTGGRIYGRLSAYLQKQRIGDIQNPKLVCDVVSALCRVQRLEIPLFHQIVNRSVQDTLFMHMEHLISIARDFAYLQFSSMELNNHMASPIRLMQLRECSPTALSYIPYILSTWDKKRSPILDIMDVLCRALIDANSYFLRSSFFYRDKDDVWSKSRKYREAAENELIKQSTARVLPYTVFVEEEEEEELMEFWPENLLSQYPPRGVQGYTDPCKVDSGAPYIEDKESLIFQNASSATSNTCAIDYMTINELVFLLHGFDTLKIRNVTVLDYISLALVQQMDTITASHLPAILHGFSDLSHSNETFLSVLENLLQKHASALKQEELLSCIWSTYALGIANTSTGFQCLLSAFIRICKAFDNPSAIHLLQVLVRCLQYDALDRPHQRIPETQYEFNKYIEDFFSFTPSLPSQEESNALQIVSKYLQKQKIRHSVNYASNPFTIPIAILDRVVSSTTSEYLMGSMKSFLEITDTPTSASKDPILSFLPHPYAKARQLVSSFGGDTLSSVHPFPGPHEEAVSFGDASTKPHGTALFIIPSMDSLQVAEWPTDVDVPPKVIPTQKRMVAYARIRESLLNRMGWRIAYLTEDSLKTVAL